MEKKLHAIWVIAIHRKMDEVEVGRNCPACMPFKDKSNYSWEFRINYYWGMCDEHVAFMKELLKEDVQIHLDLEKALGINYPEGFDRYLPSGKYCTMRSPLWCDYLLKLASDM
ncbi:hypothetical protein A2572_04175 [Candidatus Collierbacteria bacterium RIFOXYD1_FULL_40_9]|uniref:Uncharacterized protein n=1 Tax=Candidatus Collierbacteria bacterium RIFOXYD1_FULL_40_9 TaxID=1817731 RepID=A0A1F5FPH5_9BACT|nr:MAG: hypothetical protein A2572_04175 [Candidatus Collierbacteria bacterium RIFOXYD1_FULL_40_9]